MLRALHAKAGATILITPLPFAETTARHSGSFTGAALAVQCTALYNIAFLLHLATACGWLGSVDEVLAQSWLSRCASPFVDGATGLRRLLPPGGESRCQPRGPAAKRAFRMGRQFQS